MFITTEREKKMNTFNNDYIQSDKYQYRDEILDAIGRLLNFYTEKHSKVLVVRFDIHYPQDFPPVMTNTDISKCIAYVIKKYKRQRLDPYYIWVSEYQESIHPHYHCCILLDAQKVRAYSHVFNTVEQTWGRILDYPINGCIHHCNTVDGVVQMDRNGMIIRRDDQTIDQTLQQVYNQVTYLAKATSKPQENDGLRNFGMSRIPHNL
jgi:hypothetical protein